MYNVILFDDNYENLKPLTFTRPVSALRIGILTIREKWELLLGGKAPISVATSLHLTKKYPTHLEKHQNLAINASIVPTIELQRYLVNDMPNNCMLLKGEIVVALKATGEDTQAFLEGNFEAVSYTHLTLPTKA